MKKQDENAVGCHAFNYQSETLGYRVVDSCRLPMKGKYKVT